MNKSACSVAATYKPPMRVPRVRLPAGALQLADAGERPRVFLQANDEEYVHKGQNR